MPFETERLIVRPWSVSEAARCFEIYSDPRVTEFLGGGPSLSLEEQQVGLHLRGGLVSRLAVLLQGLQDNPVPA